MVRRPPEATTRQHPAGFVVGMNPAGAGRFLGARLQPPERGELAFAAQAAPAG